MNKPKKETLAAILADMFWSSTGPILVGLASASFLVVAAVGGVIASVYYGAPSTCTPNFVPGFTRRSNDDSPSAAQPR